MHVNITGKQFQDLQVKKIIFIPDWELKRVAKSSLDSNIRSKSLNNTYLNMIKKLFFHFKEHRFWVSHNGRVGSTFALRSKGRGFKSRWFQI